jgi:hypothetical protein
LSSIALSTLGAAIKGATSFSSEENQSKIGEIQKHLKGSEQDSEIYPKMQ